MVDFTAVAVQKLAAEDMLEIAVTKDSDGWHWSGVLAAGQLTDTVATVFAQILSLRSNVVLADTAGCGKENS